MTDPRKQTLLADSVDAARFDIALDQLLNSHRPRYRRLWAYYRNPMRLAGIAASPVGSAGSERPYRQAQEWGLPSRITGVVAGAEPFAQAASVTGRARKEVVIENDIGWRVDTLVEYLFGKAVAINSAAPDRRRRQIITRLLNRILELNGGMELFQQLALAGAVYGFVDVLVKLDVTAAAAVLKDLGDTAPLAAPPKLAFSAVPTNEDLAHQSPSDAPTASEAPDDPAGPAPIAASPAATAAAAGPAQGGLAPSSGLDDHQDTDPGAADPAMDALIERIARLIRLEVVEPARALPLVCPQDWRIVEAYAQVWEPAGPAGVAGESPALSRASWWDRLRSLFVTDPRRPQQGALASADTGPMIELITPTHWARLEGGTIVAHGVNSLGELPLVHIQNVAEAQSYAGSSDVEPLIPLQDELNTRLSDRAHRITLQSFKMYLGKGLEQFTDQPVSPGRMWMTDNEQADITEFGGDSSCPSEDAHIADLREALDKTSGVTPIAAGAIKNRIGRLTSAAALRITLLALLSKTDRKRAIYETAIGRICELSLQWLDVAGLFPTRHDERAVELNWPSPLPENTIEKLQEAESKLRIGVDREIVLRELGY